MTSHWWVAELEKRVSAPDWRCVCSGMRMCTKDTVHDSGLLFLAYESPESVLTALDNLSLPCLVAALASILVERLVGLSPPGPNPDEDGYERSHIPVGYSMARWQTLASYVCARMSTPKDTLGFTLSMRLLEADSAWVLYQALSFLWDVSLVGGRDISPVGLRLRQHGIHRPLIRLLKHSRATIVLSTIGSLVPLLCDGDEAYILSLIEAGLCTPLKQLMAYPCVADTSITARNLIIDKATNVVGWLACGGRACQNALVDAGMLETLMPLLTHENAEITKTAWMATNWLVSVDTGKQWFLQANGLALVLATLQKVPLGSGVVFTTRKLAMHAPTQRALLEAGVLPLLIQRASELGTGEGMTRMRYIISIALSFLILDKRASDVDTSAAHACIVQMLGMIPIDRDLNVVYSTFADHKQLIQNASDTAQYFGLWWILHLLVGELKGFYKIKNYAHMLLDEGLLPRVLALLHSPDQRVAGTAANVLEALADHSTQTRLRLIDSGAVHHLLVVGQMRTIQPVAGFSHQRARVRFRHAADMALVYLIVLDTNDERQQQQHGNIPTLRAMCECLMVQAIEEENVGALTDMAYAMHLYRLQAACLSYLVRHPEAQRLLADVPSATQILADVQWIRSKQLLVGRALESEPPVH